MTPTAIYLILLGIFSLLVGSFLNVVIYRLPIMLKAEWKKECEALLTPKKITKTKAFNLWFPRSHCPQCQKTIPFWHNIPVLSFILLKARCVFCKQPIAWQYPFIEALTLVLSLCAAIHFGFTPALGFALLLIWGLISLTSIDLKHQLLPDSLTLGLLWLGLLANTQALFTPLPDAVFGAVAGYLTLWLVMKLFYYATGKIGMGHGDFKLLAAFGAWFGWMLLPAILLLSSVLGAIAGLVYLKKTKQSKETPIPFGPFLCLAGFITLFWGQAMLQLLAGY